MLGRVVCLACLAVTGCAGQGRQFDNPEAKGEMRKAAQAGMGERLIGKSATLLVQGMACPSCAANIERQLMQTRGVLAVEIDVSNSVVRVALDPTDPPTHREVKEAIQYAGGVLVSLEQP